MRELGVDMYDARAGSKQVYKGLPRSAGRAPKARIVEKYTEPGCVRRHGTAVETGRTKDIAAPPRHV